jgi:hypothetical protein
MTRASEKLIIHSPDSDGGPVFNELLKCYDQIACDPSSNTGEGNTSEPTKPSSEAKDKKKRYNSETINRLSPEDEVAFESAKPINKINKKEEKTKKFSLDAIRKFNKNAYQKWTPEEEAKLKKMFANGKTMKGMASELGRQEGGIKARLKKLGLIK